MTPLRRAAEGLHSEVNGVFWEQVPRGATQATMQKEEQGEASLPLVEGIPVDGLQVTGRRSQ